MKTAYYEYGVADLLKPRKPNGVPHITKYRIKVEVIDIGVSRTKVRFLERHIDGRKAGTITNVKNKNVIYIDKNNNHVTDTIRLPYKDD